MSDEGEPYVGRLMAPGQSLSARACASLTLQTDIWLVVRVPVLSEQMTEVQPRVSTEGKLLTIAFFFAIRRVPKARQVVMTAGRPVRGRSWSEGWIIEMGRNAPKDIRPRPWNLWMLPYLEKESLLTRLANGARDRRTFWDCSHSQGHSDLKVVDGATEPGAPVDGVIEVANVDEPHGHADERDDLGELLPKLVQLLLQRGLVLLCGGHLVSDLPNLGAHTSCGHDADGLASCNVGALGRYR